MDAKQFLIIARYLSQHRGASEASYRSAISRAYYACYISMRDHVYDKFKGNPLLDKCKDRGNIGHTTLWKFFLGGSKHAKQLGYLGGSLHGNRIKADYDMTQTVEQGDAETAVKTADKFFSTFSTIPEIDIVNATNHYLKQL